ncbi:phosphoenolpyruvate--protein phosphotransferase [Miniphocaeibacter halophilus]|uniref:Phosphoenolpyruvate--protein phosphotransferase n=1 Tax=Miniphocaeibacter halophilus TaxID=2931922 RepID=A0AC61MNL1_9FIRM|nr:phosphoenolpyruvate--protein phosphotransferase [Miniphocaeibacter halophilus]QQK07119.1 phosphoenolpyruvate--protein phosphotransferase [Miniphocaeibacter halophilus]
MSTIKTGIIASEGIAIGRAYLFVKEKLEVDTRILEDGEIEGEVAKIQKAIADYSKDLENMEVSTETQQEVINAHLGMLDDPFLVDTVKNKIENNINAEKALHDSINEMVTMMQSLDDEYLRERATDYKDIGERLLYKLQGREPKKLSPLPKDTIVVSDELTPTDTSAMDKDNVLGFAMDNGGKTAHTSIIAQTLGIPALVGMKDVSVSVKDNDLLIMDTFEGKLYINPDEDTLNIYREKMEQILAEKERLEAVKFEKAITKDNHQVEIACNIGNIEDLKLGLANGAEGVGLFRTEFLYMENNHFPTEEEQFSVYKKAVELLEDKPLIIRTLDIGGDKSLSYFKFPEEENPFLGWRALRICFDMLDVFKTQLKAILRASAFGKVRILLPMVISVEEIKKVREILEEVKNDLKAKEIDFDTNIEIGIMVETPASVIVAEDLIKYVDYFSIGTNDLTQYVLAVDRGNEKISKLYNTYNPAVLRSIKKVIDAAHKADKWAGMCGGFAGDTKATKLLLGMGLDEFSAPAANIPKIKDIIINTTLEEASEFSEEILKLETTTEIEEVINNQ